MKISIDRIVAFFGPPIAVVSTAVATWLIAKVNVLSLPAVGSKDHVVTYIAAGVTALLTGGLHALGGWSWLKGRHIILANEARGAANTTITPGSGS